MNSLGGLNEVQVVKCPASDWRLGIGSAKLAIDGFGTQPLKGCGLCVKFPILCLPVYAVTSRSNEGGMSSCALGS